MGCGATRRRKYVAVAEPRPPEATQSSSSGQRREAGEKHANDQPPPEPFEHQTVRAQPDSPTDYAEEGRRVLLSGDSQDSHRDVVLSTQPALPCSPESRDAMQCELPKVVDAAEGLGLQGDSEPEDTLALRTEECAPQQNVNDPSEVPFLSDEQNLVAVELSQGVHQLETCDGLEVIQDAIGEVGVQVPEQANQNPSSMPSPHEISQPSPQLHHMPQRSVADTEMTSAAEIRQAATPEHDAALVASESLAFQEEIHQSIDLKSEQAASVAELLKGLFGCKSSTTDTSCGNALAPTVEEENGKPSPVDTSCQQSYTHVQFIAYEICTRPPMSYEVVESDELKEVLAAVAVDGLPWLMTDVTLATGTLRKGTLVKAVYFPRQRHWLKVDHRSQLPSKGWCALRLHIGETSAEARLAADLAARIELLREALRSAASLDGVDPSPQTLKLFMAPEFLLRGRAAATNREEVLGDAKDSRSLAGQLHTLIAEPNWTHWQCLFGTVLGVDVDAESDHTGNAAETYNMAIMLKGGLGQATRDSRNFHTFIKRHQNGVDALQRGVDLDARAVAEAANKRGGVNTRNSAESMLMVMKSALSRADAIPKPVATGNVFQVEDDEIIVNMSGCCWGVEVCLDHDMARLKRELRSRAEPKSIDVQLVTSCGMDVRRSSVAVRPGGLVFHCDGLHGVDYGAHSAAFIWGEVGPRTTIPVCNSAQPHGLGWKEKLKPDGIGDLFSTSFPETAMGPMVRVYDPAPLPQSDKQQTAVEQH